MHDEHLKQLNPRAKWQFFIWALLAPFTLLLFSGGIIVAILTEDQDSIALLAAIITLAAIVLLALGIAYIWASLTYRFYRYQLRPDAFRKEHGIIWKRYVSIPYERIQNVDIYRGLIARLLGLSDIQIQTAGMSSVKGSYGAGSEGRLPGLDKHEAEKIRDELIRRAKGMKHQDGV